MSKLKSVRISGWKSFDTKQPKTELGDINVFIGANGTGKSNLISFFKLMNELVGERLQLFVAKSGGADSILHYGSRVTPLMEAELEFDVDNAKDNYFIRLVHAAVDTLIFSEERLTFHRPSYPQPWAEALGAGHKETLLRSQADEGNVTARVFRRILSQCRVFHFHDTSDTASIRQSCYVEANRHLLPDAGNLAAMLHMYQQTLPAVYRRIVDTVRKVSPGFGEFVLAPKRLDPSSILLNWTQQGSDYLFGPHQFSDGTLRAIALITLFLQPEADLPDVIVLDEPELGLHPQAIELVAGLIRAVSHQTQVILATQSTAFVDQFAPEEIVVTEMVDGSSRFRRLDSQELAGWLEDYSVGDLWRKNVLGGGPVP